jgi:hypothetical protein
MSYSTGNPPFLIVAAIAGGNISIGTTNAPSFTGNIWAYKSSDAFSTVNGSSYFSDGYKRGMRVGDPVWIFDTTNTVANWSFVTAVTTSQSGSQGGGGATVAGTYSSTH